MIPPSVYLNREEKFIEVSDFPKIMLKVSSTFYEKYDEKKNAEETLSVKNEEKDKKSEESKEKQKESQDLCNKIEDKNICSICCSKDSDAILMNCGHGGICFDCCCALWMKYKKCYICRGEIKIVMQFKQRNISTVEIQKAVKLTNV
jgi:hypothetical protein